MDQQTQELVKKTVLEILESSDLSTTTVTKVRIATTNRIHIDLSTSDRKKFVRDVVHAFIFSQTEPEKKQDNADILICKLTKKRRVTIHEYKGNKMVCIRGFYKDKKGNLLPSKTGINLSFDEWATLSKAVPKINAAVKMVQLQEKNI